MPKDIETFSFDITVMDKDAVDDDYIDYCHEPDGNRYTHTYYLENIKKVGSHIFSYEGDDAKSCKLKYKVSVVNE